MSDTPLSSEAERPLAAADLSNRTVRMRPVAAAEYHFLGGMRIAPRVILGCIPARPLLRGDLG
jgi:hypothetical protein